MSSERRRRRWAAGLALLLPVILLCAPFLFTSECLLGEDCVFYYVPQAVLARQTLMKEGDLPRWNLYQYAGTPYLGSWHNNYYYPANWILLAFPPSRGLGVLCAFHLMLACWGMYRLTRTFRLSRAACVLAGISYGLSFGLVARLAAGHLPHLATESQAPLLLCLIVRGIQRPTIVHMAALGVWIGLVLLAGHPQFVYHLLFLAIAVVGWQWVGVLRRRENWKRAAASIGGSALLGVLLSSVHLLPALEVSRESFRAAASAYAESSPPADESLTPADSFFMFIPHCPWETGSEPRIAPQFFWWEKRSYVGVLTLILAALSLLGSRRGPSMFFAISGGVLALDGTASLLPFHSLFCIFPKYDTFRIPSRIVWTVILCLSVMSAFGWDGIASGKWTRKRLHGCMIGFTCVILGIAALFAFHYHILKETGLFLVLSMGSIGLISFAPSLRNNGKFAVALLALDLWTYGHSILQTVSREHYERAPWYASCIGEERADYRVLNTTAIETSAVQHGFQLLNGSGHPLLRSTVQYYRGAWGDYPGPTANGLGGGLRLVQPQILDQLSVKWIVSPAQPLARSWRRIGSNDSLSLYENPSAQPIVSAPEGGEIVISHRSMNGFRFSCQCDHAQEIVISEAWMPGWRATVNGKSAEVHPAYGALVQVHVDSGVSEVRLVYAPTSWRIGYLLTFSGVLFVFGLLAISRVRPRLRAQSPASNGGAA